MKRDYLLLALLLVGNITFAQSPIERALNTINRSSAEATINFLASDELQGREAGFHGSRVTSEYIVSLLLWNQDVLPDVLFSDVLYGKHQKAGNSCQPKAILPSIATKKQYILKSHANHEECIGNDSR